MSRQVEAMFAVVSEIFETAAGYALVAVGLYAAVFVDIAGGGSLWRTVQHLQEGELGLESPNATRVIKVPARAAVEKVLQDRILATVETPSNDTVAAVYQAPEATGQRPSAAFTDTPADPGSGRTWKRSLQGELQTFTVYGAGEQTTSASAPVGKPSRQASAPEPAVAAAEGSPAGAVTASVARPGLGSRLSRGALSSSGASRNAR